MGDDKTARKVACGPSQFSCWLGDRDSNPGLLIQSQLSYH